MKRWAAAVMAVMSLAGCQVEETSVRKVRPDVYEISRVACGYRTAANDAQPDLQMDGMRPVIEQRAARYCPSGYSLSDLQMSDSGMRGSAVTGECPTVTLSATVHCGAAHSRE